MAQDNIVAVIDIGSAETKVLIVELVRKLNIVGWFSAKTEGMKKGEIVNLKALKESVHEVIQSAEKDSGVAGRIRSACLSVSGMAVGGFPVRGLTSVKSKSGKVSQADKDDALADAHRLVLHNVRDGRRTLQLIRRRFLLDGREVEEPSTGSALSCEMWVVDADENYLSELVQIPNSYGMTVKGLFPASLAAAESVRTFSEMDKNRLVIDIGAGTTDFALFCNGALACTGIVPVGGSHISKDLSHGLEIPPETAERIKCNPKYGHAFVKNTRESVFGEIDIDTSDDALKNFPERPTVSRYKLERITEERLRELFQIINKKISPFGFSGTIFLTGGTSLLPGIEKLAASAVFHLETRCAEPNLDFAKSFNDPKFATVVGLAQLYRDELLRERSEASRGRGPITFLRSLFK